ncbi:holin [Hungatella effluvii]|uniref:holin n=1 Tax=Hungatella TaxID=1649459 RepID=UPI001F593156|nr:holin [Hungatella effluvii]
MFENCVFKADVDTIKWAKAAARRAVKTMAQTAVATIGTAAVLGDVNGLMVISASVLSGILSILTSVAGLPELDSGAA